MGAFGSSLLRATATFGLDFATFGFWRTAVSPWLAAICSRLATFGQFGATVLHFAGSFFLATCARTFFACATLSIGGAVAGLVATAAVLAGAEFLFGAGAVGLVAALLGFAATVGRLAATEDINILLNSRENHLAYAL